MIILRSRSLIIPNDEYNLGNDYDTSTATRVFQLDRVMEGIDLGNLLFKLDLTYADGTNDTLALDSEVTDDKINLTWTVTKNQLHVPGTVVVQIRALNVDGNMKWTSYIGAFFVEASLFGSTDYTGKLSEIEQFETAIASEKERVQNEKARQDAEAERVQAEAERKAAEEERKTAESERKSAETVRSNAESGRISAETEREEWYNAAKANFDAAVASGDKAEQIANSLESNVETNMKAAAASATAAAGSASAAAGSANEAKEYSQNWSALDQRVTKNANDIATTNNNLSNTDKTVTQLYSDSQTLATNLNKANGKILSSNYVMNYLDFADPLIQNYVVDTMAASPSGNAPDNNNDSNMGDFRITRLGTNNPKYNVLLLSSPRYKSLASMSQTFFIGNFWNGVWMGWERLANKSALDSLTATYNTTRANYGKGSIFLETIETFSSPAQLTHAGFFKIKTMTEAVNTDAGSEKMTEYTIGDFYGLLLGTDINTTDGCNYGTLIISSPRINNGIWICTIWEGKICHWYKVKRS